jgi:hypothetical protein
MPKRIAKVYASISYEYTGCFSALERLLVSRLFARLKISEQEVRLIKIELVQAEDNKENRGEEELDELIELAHEEYKVREKIHKLFEEKLVGIQQKEFDIGKEVIEDLLRINCEDPTENKDPVDYLNENWLDNQFFYRAQVYKSFVEEHRVQDIKFLSWLSKSRIFYHQYITLPTKEERKRYIQVKKEFSKLASKSLLLTRQEDFLTFCWKYSFNKSWLIHYSTLSREDCS